MNWILSLKQVFTHHKPSNENACSKIKSVKREQNLTQNVNMCTRVKVGKTKSEVQSPKSKLDRRLSMSARSSLVMSGIRGVVDSLFPVFCVPTKI